MMLTNSIGLDRLRRLMIATACLTGILTLGGRVALAGVAGEQNAARATEAEQVLSNLGYWVRKVNWRADAENIRGRIRKRDRSRFLFISLAMPV